MVPTAAAILGLIIGSSTGIAADEQAGDSLPDVPGAWRYGPDVVYSKGSSTDWMFHPMSRAIGVAEVTAIRVSMKLDQDSGGCAARPALRFGDDGLTWDNAKEIDTNFFNAPGIVYGGAYVDILGLGTAPRNYVQFGVQVRNTSGSNLEFCKATLAVQVKQSPSK